MKRGPETTKCEGHHPGPQSVLRAVVSTSVLSTGHRARHGAAGRARQPPLHYASAALGTFPSPWMSAFSSVQRTRVGPLLGGRAPRTQLLWLLGMSFAGRHACILSSRPRIWSPILPHLCVETWTLICQSTTTHWLRLWLLREKSSLCP